MPPVTQRARTSELLPGPPFDWKVVVVQRFEGPGSSSLVGGGLASEFLNELACFAPVS